jgi:hypothetical protein
VQSNLAAEIAAIVNADSALTAGKHPITMADIC